MQSTTSTLTFSNYLDHFLARWAWQRNDHRVAPGLYALGKPDADSPVFVTANYTLSFDALRAALRAMNAYILVLDTQGINIWCAAGKGTFGTDELVRQIEATQLRDVVKHRVVIVPQLGAPGIAAHEIKKRTTFKVEYGPVRASDLPEYLKTHQATPAMRRVRFDVGDRIVLIPVELVGVLIPLLLVALILQSIPAVVAILAGVVLFPILLPFLPTRDFSTKGFILGTLVTLPFAINTFLKSADVTWWMRIGWTLTYLALPAVTAFLALNFTGTTTFTSRSGVRREMFAYIPTMAWSFGIGIVLMIALSLTRMLGG